MIIISKPKPEDAKGIHDMMKTSWYATYPNKEIGVTKGDGDLSYTPEVEQKQIEVLRHRAEHQKNTDISLVAKENEKIVGFIRLKIGENFTDLVSLYVDPDFTGKGIGTELWNEAYKSLPKDKPIYVEVVSYTKAKDFYTKIGFVKIEEYLDKEPLLSSGIHLPLTKMVFK
ncbi:MAG: hypothetical protein QG589_151 [Patescibacteria group bacterium]|nr:hypothetical protein [Patescibacteria group bacterium]